MTGACTTHPFCPPPLSLLGIEHWPTHPIINRVPGVHGTALHDRARREGRRPHAEPRSAAARRRGASHVTPRRRLCRCVSVHGTYVSLSRYVSVIETIETLTLVLLQSRGLLLYYGTVESLLSFIR